jgi:CheY-like chemotaxis protein
MDGLEASKRIRDREKGQNQRVPIIGLSGKFPL